MGNITFSFGSGLNDSIFGKSQAPIKKLIETKAEAWEQRSMLKYIYSHGKSRHFAEKFSTMTAMNGPQPVGEGGAYPVDGTQVGFEKTISHMVWKDSFHITREAVDDSTTIDLRKKPTTFTNGFFRVKEEFGAQMLVAPAQGKTSLTYRGMKFDTAGADGKALFATDHPAKVKGAAQSNKFAGAFSNTVLGQVATRMQNFVGDNGEILAVAPDTIIIPNDEKLKYDVFEAIGADKDPDTSNNGFNYHYGMWTVIVWPYLNALISDTDKPFILLDSNYNTENDGAVWLERVKMEVRSELADNDDNVWKGYERYGVGFNDWRAFAVGGVTGATTL